MSDFLDELRKIKMLQLAATGYTWCYQDDYRKYENMQGVTKPLSNIKIGDYFKYDDALWKVVKITELKKIIAIMQCDFNIQKHGSWERGTPQRISPEKCLFIDNSHEHS